MTSNSKQMLLVALIAVCKVFVVMSEGIDLGALVEAAAASAGGSVNTGAMPTCFQKLVPCESYLKSPDSAPDSCCSPLKELISDDMNCLCQVFNSPDLLKNFNVTQDEALKLPKACGSNVDASICKKDSPSGSPGTSGTSAGPPPEKSNSTSAANGMKYFGGTGLGVCFVSLIMSAAM